MFVPIKEATALIKVMAFFFTWAGFWLPIAIPLAIVLKWHPQKPISVAQKLPLMASLYLIAPLIVWGAAGIENVPFSNYGLAWEPSLFVHLGLGFGLGVFSLAILFGLQWALGWISWQPADISKLASALLPTLLLGLWVGGTEELIFRGFLLNQLLQDYSIWVAAAISSAIFAILHLVWEVRETLPQLPGLWLLGMVLVLARACDGGSLGLAWGLHAGWIWAIASLDTAQLINYTGTVPAWITGLGKKPLAGGVGILLLLATSSLLWLVLSPEF